MYENDAEGDPWYEKAFGDFYADLYAHRSAKEAIALLAALDRVHRLQGPVLDVACGGGRLLRELTIPGRDAFGVDLSLPLLRRARELGPDLSVARSDMRQLPFVSGRFSSVFFLFTSFGYFEDPAEDLAVLKGAARVLAHGGWVVLDFLNPQPTVGGLVARSSREVGEFQVEERRVFSAQTKQIRKSVEVWQSGGIQLEYEECVRVYEHDEFIEIFAQAGLTVEDTWGDYDGAEFDVNESPRMILHARKKD